MSLFLLWKAEIITINYLGIALNIPLNMASDGYIAMDCNGDVWIYSHKPTTLDDHWAITESVGCSSTQVLCMSDYTVVLGETHLIEYIAKDVWKNSVVKISDCPVITF